MGEIRRERQKMLKGEVLTNCPQASIVKDGRLRIACADASKASYIEHENNVAR
ncbi:MAG: hypothetical protein ACXVBZ_09710 [Flavisolibacter sp.]